MRLCGTKMAKWVQMTASMCTLLSSDGTTATRAAAVNCKRWTGRGYSGIAGLYLGDAPRGEAAIHEQCRIGSGRAQVASGASYNGLLKPW